MTDHEKIVYGWFLFSCFVQALPEPICGDPRWYGSVYRFAHLVGLNFRLLASVAGASKASEGGEKTSENTSETILTNVDETGSGKKVR